MAQTHFASVAFDWGDVLIGIALPVTGGVLTYLGTAGLGVLAKKRAEKKEYARLHELVYALVDDALTAANQIASSEAAMSGGKPVMNPWAITNDYWIMVKARYAELSPSPDEVHEISKFFQYAAELAVIARRMIEVGWNRGPIDRSVISPSWTVAEGVITDLRDRMEAQAAKLKTTYGHPYYKPVVFPHNPNEPRKFSKPR